VTSQEAKEILSVYRPGSVDANDAEFAEALALARQDAELGRWFDDHCAVYHALRTRFRKIAVPEGLKEQILSEHRARSVVVWWRAPAVLAAAAAVALLAAMAALWLNLRPDRPAPENFAAYRSRMVKAVLRNYAMTLETNDLNQIRAHLAQRQAPMDYVLPGALERTATAGCGVLSWQDKRVAMICFRTGKPLGPGQKSDLFLFVVDRNALPDAPAGGTPEITRVNKLVTASWSVGDKTYVLAAPGDESLIRRYL
jgi:uncharacterized membrane protein YbaN (DUF454 family)